MHFDYSVLSQPVTFKEIVTYFQKQTAVYKVAIGFAVVVDVIFVLIIISIFSGFSTNDINPTGGIFIWAVTIGAIVVGLSLPIAFIRSISHELRMKRFAAANHMECYAGLMNDTRSGLIFQKGDKKRFGMLFMPAQGYIKEFGNYSYSVGDGDDTHTYTYGFVHIKLPRKLPNMVLDSHTNNLFGESTLPEKFSKNQELRLEGDFNKYFTLYAPVEYKRDALYIFTPDVMQAMIGASHHYDGEIVDDDFYLYTSELMITDTKTVEELLSIAETIAKQLGEQADTYSDERVGQQGQNTIAAQGVRLSHSVTVAVQAFVVIALVIVVYFIITLLYL